MAFLETVAPERRIGAGLFFLIIAMGILVVQPVSPLLTGVLAIITLLASAVFFVTVGRDTTSEPAYDVGFWLLSVVTALGMYLATGFVLEGDVDTVGLLVFVIGFGLVLGVLAELRAKLTGRREN